MLTIVGAAGLGVALGLLGAKAVVLGWWTLLPWAVGGAAVGYVARRRAALAGASYGFVLSFAFMLRVYTGRAPALSRVPFFALLGVVGALCGSSLAVAGRWLAVRTAVRRASSSIPPDER